ncbi:AsmA-like C-terminal region-containing protein [Silvibacterium sp.]|uniref:AsmA-like C-terminal region-containing protein n=1 Tax=Silvibacterium sp. TaxID=1964179 RepID=UPI0039E23DBE
MEDRPASVSSPTPRHRGRRILLWFLLVLVILGAGAFIAADFYLHRAAPILRARIIDTLSTRFDSRVELDRFDVSVLRGFEVSGGGLKIYPNNLDMDAPLFSVERFSFHTGWQGLFHSPTHIGQVQISGLGINMPPKDQRKGMPKLQKPGEEAHKRKIEVVVDELLINNATLILKTDKPGKIPLEFDIASLRLTSVGAGQPMHFHAILTNPKPVGNIDTTGSFGPYVTASPGDTPVAGVYDFSHADLNSIKGIGGMLSSTGKYQGTLNSIVVDGQTDTPNFSLDTANHPMPLHTNFHAIVDGTNGDTYLQPVDATLGHSHILAKGDVVRAEGGRGHDIHLDVTVDHANIADMLQLGVKTEPPLMTGALKLQTKLYLPPGKVRVTDKLHLQGTFQITNAHFTNPKIQGKVDQLSLRAQGKPKEANQESKGGEAANEASTMQGEFALGDSKLTISHLVYTVPGANIAMDGVYSLDGKQFDFHGKARLDAHVSQMVTGWKSALLKLADPFFAKNGAGTEVPISVTGTNSEPHFGLDFGHKDKEKNGNPPQQQGGTPPPAQPQQ